MTTQALLLTLVIGCGNPTSHVIPLSSITSTSGQEELQPAKAGTRIENGKAVYVSEFGYILQQIFNGSDSGASNVFLVEAPQNINDAVSASSGVLIGERTAEIPAPLNKPDPPRGNYWMIVYLGCAGSEPAKWIVERVAIENCRIRFSYYSPVSPETCDVHHYFYWIPLGSLAAGNYELELYDIKQKAVTLMRRVPVGR
jgi:hypothetical protein